MAYDTAMESTYEQYGLAMFTQESPWRPVSHSTQQLSAEGTITNSVQGIEANNFIPFRALVYFKTEVFGESPGQKANSLLCLKCSICPS